jgi:hypothetical protein
MPPITACLPALLLAAAALLLLLPAPARAESLRCHGASVAENDSRLALLHKCGPPLLADSFCAPVYLPGAWYPLPAALAGAVAGCQLVEEWLYDRGPGSLMATVRLRDGRVLAIRYGQQPR